VAFIGGTQIVLRDNNVECHLQTPGEKIQRKEKNVPSPGDR